MTGIMSEIVQADVFVSSVQFSESSMELTFLEHHDQAEDVAMMKSMMLSLETDPELQQAFRDLQLMLVEIIDNGFYRLRNPERKMSIRDRMLQRKMAEEVAAADEKPEAEEAAPEEPPTITRWP